MGRHRRMGDGEAKWGALGRGLVGGTTRRVQGTRPFLTRLSVHLSAGPSAACHILECCDGLAQSVINTVGQAFELRFKQYLHSPPKAVVPPDR